MRLIKTILGFLFNQLKLISPLFLQSSNLKKIFNYYKVPDLFETSGQPNNKQLISIANGGYEAVINLAPNTTIEGRIINEAIKNLYNKGIKNIKSVNRSVKEINISDSYKILSSPLSNLHSSLEDVDIVIASSTTELPIIGKGAIENSLSKRGAKPLLLIDLAVPRNIEEEVKDIERVYLYSIDDIEKITQDNLGQRKIEAEKALNMIVRETQAVMLELKDVDFKSSLNREIINLLDSLSDEELVSFHMENNHKDLIINILKNNAFYNDSFESIKKINLVDRHIVNSMVKRYFDA